MNNTRMVAKFVAANPDSADTPSLLELAVALETGAEFSFTKLYELSHEGFQLAMGMIDDWRLDRRFLSKLTLLDQDEGKRSFQ